LLDVLPHGVEVEVEEDVERVDEVEPAGEVSRKPWAVEEPELDVRLRYRRPRPPKHVRRDVQADELRDARRDAHRDPSPAHPDLGHPALRADERVDELRDDAVDIGRCGPLLPEDAKIASVNRGRNLRIELSL